MKKAILLSTLALLTMVLLSACESENFSKALEGEWRLVGWENEGTFHEVDSNLVEHHRFSIEFQDNGSVCAYSLVNETYFVGAKFKQGRIKKDETVQTAMASIFDDSEFYDRRIGDISRYQVGSHQLKLYYSDKDYFLFTNQFTDKARPTFTCGENIVKYVSNLVGTIVYDTQFQKMCLHFEYPHSAEVVDIYYSKSESYLWGFNVGQRVVFSGDVYEVNINWGGYSPVPSSGSTRYCIDLKSISEYHI